MSHLAPLEGSTRRPSNGTDATISKWWWTLAESPDCESDHRTRTRMGL